MIPPPMRVQRFAFGQGRAHDLGPDPEATLCNLPYGEHPTEADRDAPYCRRCQLVMRSARRELAESDATIDEQSQPHYNPFVTQCDEQPPEYPA